MNAPVTVILITWLLFVGYIGKKSHNLSRQEVCVQLLGDPFCHLNAISLNAHMWTFASISSSQIARLRHMWPRHTLLKLNTSRLELQLGKQSHALHDWIKIPHVHLYLSVATPATLIPGMHNFTSGNYTVYLGALVVPQNLDRWSTRSDK